METETAASDHDLFNEKEHEAICIYFNDRLNPTEKTKDILAHILLKITEKMEAYLNELICWSDINIKLFLSHYINEALNFPSFKLSKEDADLYYRKLKPLIKNVNGELKENLQRLKDRIAKTFWSGSTFFHVSLSTLSF